MARIRVVDSNGKGWPRIKVGVSVNGGGMVDGFTGSDGWAHISTSGGRGKVYLDGRQRHDGNLDGVIIQK